MLNYRINNRHHIINGPHVSAGMWPSSASNWWEAGGATGCVAAYQPKGAASYAASLVNLANPGTYNLTETAASPIWDAAVGWTFVPAMDDARLAMGISVSSGYTAICRHDNESTSNRSPFGHSSSPRFLSVSSYLTGVYFSWGTQDGFDDGGEERDDGVIAMATGAGGYGYWNGVPRLALSAFTGSTSNFYIGGTVGSTYFYFGSVKAIAVYNNMLDGTKVAAVSAAMAAL
jgi:hypothetical protein